MWRKSGMPSASRSGPGSRSGGDLLLPLWGDSLWDWQHDLRQPVSTGCRHQPQTDVHWNRSQRTLQRGCVPARLRFCTVLFLNTIRVLFSRHFVPLVSTSVFTEKAVLVCSADSRMLLVNFDVWTFGGLLLDRDSGTICHITSAARAIIRSIQTVAEDVFIWAVRPQRRVVCCLYSMYLYPHTPVANSQHDFHFRQFFYSCKL